MSLYTVNLSKARAKGRNKRAKKAAALLREELERQEGEEVSVSNEVNQEIWSRGASKPPRKITVEVEDFGDQRRAVISERENEAVTQSSGDESADESSQDEGRDYEEIVSGTVSDAKEAINELESPDYKALIEAEKEGKDRKTLIEFIEGKQ